MKSHCRGLVLSFTLALAVLAAGRAQETRTPAEQVLELAQKSEAGKDIDKQAAALGQKFGNVRAAMRLYNARNQRPGGIGFGPQGQGIERRLLNLGEQHMTADALKKESVDLTRVAHINLVVAEITRGLAPEKPVAGSGKKEWERDVEAMKSASQDLTKALKAGDPRAVQTAATRINKACISCHDGNQ